MFFVGVTPFALCYPTVCVIDEIDKGIDLLGDQGNHSRGEMADSTCWEVQGFCIADWEWGRGTISQTCIPITITCSICTVVVGIVSPKTSDVLFQIAPSHVLQLEMRSFLLPRL